MIDTTQMRLIANSHDWRDGVASFMLDAADEIERLRAEKAKLREAAQAAYDRLREVNYRAFAPERKANAPVLDLLQAALGNERPVT